MKPNSSARRLTFRSKLKRIAAGMDYFALPVPEKTTLALKTHGPVPVSARVNESEAFIASLYPVGGGQHYLRVRKKICRSVHITAGDPVRVEIQIRDRRAEVTLPKDVASALHAQGVLKIFQTLPLGKRAYLLRLIQEAVKPETRRKRIQDAVTSAQARTQL
jgi:hypothetical protein